MCGLFGFSKQESAKLNVQAFKFLALLNKKRGVHAWGVYNGTKDILQKAPVSIYEGLTQLQDNVFVFDSAIDGNAVIGHTRAYTGGSLNAAHPFKVGDDKHFIVGTHNGFFLPALCNKISNAEDIPYSSTVDVDSEFFYKVLWKNNLDYNKVFGQFEGAAAFAFILSDQPETIYVYHRSSRPLAYGFLDGVLMYSSEAIHLQLVCCKDVQEFPEDILFGLRDGMIVSRTEIVKPKVHLPLNFSMNDVYKTLSDDEQKALGIEPYKYPSYNYPNYGGTTWWGNKSYYDYSYDNTPDQTKSVVNRIVDNNKDIVELANKAASRLVLNNTTILDKTYLFIRVLDAGSKKPIPCCKVEINNKVLYTNGKGYVGLVWTENTTSVTIIVWPPTLGGFRATKQIERYRVQEVTLFIPFRSQPTLFDNNGNTGGNSNAISSDVGPVQTGNVNERRRLPEGAKNNKCRGDEKHEKVREKSQDNVLYSNYNEEAENDILDMNKYQVQVLLEELKELKLSAEEVLTSPVRDECQMISVLEKMKNFVEYQVCFFDKKLKSFE